MNKIFFSLGLMSLSSSAFAQHQIAPSAPLQAQPLQSQPLYGPYNPNQATEIPRAGVPVHPQGSAGIGGTVTPNMGTTQTVPSNGTTNPTSDLPIYRPNGGTPLSTPVPLESGSPSAPTAPGPMGF